MMRFVIIGGFLGAGKTTTIARLARAYQERGLRVGIVTNDQAADLVDTHQLRAQGFEVNEVAGACFCCRFDDLAKTLKEMEVRVRPDVILSEPVGSCTDLAATVLRPIQRFFRAELQAAPFGVIVKPSHGRKVLRNERRSGFSPKAAYILRKQLHEADFLILNRIDQLTAEEADELERLLAAEVPGVPVLRMSARTGEGFDQLLDILDRSGAPSGRILDIDYETYAEGEAELGWVNASFRVTAATPFSLDWLLTDSLARARETLAGQGAEIAHLKAAGLCEAFHAAASVISSEDPVELSTPSGRRTRTAEVIINARVAADPEQLEQIVHQAVREAGRDAPAAVELLHSRRLRPGRPVPTHRFSDPS